MSGSIGVTSDRRQPVAESPLEIGGLVDRAFLSGRQTSRPDTNLAATVILASSTGSRCLNFPFLTRAAAPFILPSSALTWSEAAHSSSVFGFEMPLTIRCLLSQARFSSPPTPAGHHPKRPLRVRIEIFRLFIAWMLSVRRLS
jgi:hypothetical protein